MAACPYEEEYKQSREPDNTNDIIYKLFQNELFKINSYLNIVEEFNIDPIHKFYYTKNEADKLIKKIKSNKDYKITLKKIFEMINTIQKINKDYDFSNMTYSFYKLEDLEKRLSTLKYKIVLIDYIISNKKININKIFNFNTFYPKTELEHYMKTNEILEHPLYITDEYILKPLDSIISHSKYKCL